MRSPPTEFAMANSSWQALLRRDYPEVTPEWLKTTNIKIDTLEMTRRPFYTTYHAIRKWILQVTDVIYDEHSFLDERFVNVIAMKDAIEKEISSLVLKSVETQMVPSELLFDVSWNIFSIVTATPKDLMMYRSFGTISNYQIVEDHLIPGIKGFLESDLGLPTKNIVHRDDN